MYLDTVAIKTLKFYLLCLAESLKILFFGVVDSTKTAMGARTLT
jgi:hypothetical protein